jgi:hypothetical protein
LTRRVGATWSACAQRLGRSLVGQALAGTLGRLERLAGRRLGAVVLFVVALVDFAVQEAAWPVDIGKNLDEYLLTYVQLLDRHPLLPWAPLYRGPGTGVVLGPLLAFDGGLLVEAGAALMFAVSVLAWARAAAYFRPRVAIVTSLALLVYPAYGELFHSFASEIVMATVFALWALAVTRAAVKPSTGRFVVAGLALAALILVRPGNAILVPFSLFPLLLRGDWRRRLIWMGGFAVAAVLPSEHAIVTIAWQDNWSPAFPHHVKPTTAATARAVDALRPRMVAASAGLMLHLCFLFVIAPELIGDRPYNVF